MGKYKVIYADPPWRYRDTGCLGAVEAQYRTMSLEELKTLGDRIRRVCAKDCALFLWVTRTHPREALALMKAWGFKFKTRAFTWVKVSRTKRSFFYGLGRWTRGNPEVVYLGVRGRPRRAAKDVKELVFAPNWGHSRKPAEVRKRIERLMGLESGEGLELFARESAEGWDSWGLEAEYGKEEL
jgi:site-specific DNA-methyltransferase (adenine-specific)